jgi:hypothetical protein
VNANAFLSPYGLEKNLKKNKFVNMCYGVNFGLNANAEHFVCFNNKKKVVGLLQTLSFLTKKLIVDKIEKFYKHI